MGSHRNKSVIEVIKKVPYLIEQQNIPCMSDTAVKQMHITQQKVVAETINQALFHSCASFVR